MSSSTNNIFDSEQPLLGGLSFFSEQREVVEEYGRVDEPVSSRLQFEHNQNDPILTDEKIELLKSSLTCISKRTRSQSGLLDWGSTLGPQGNSLNDSDEESDLSTESSDLWQSALDVRESLKNSDVGVGVQPT